MTRKDYTAFAVMLAGQKEDAPSLDADTKHRIAQNARHATWCRAVQGVADVLAADNPRFNRARFLVAAGLAS